MPKRLIDGEALWSSNTLFLLPKADCLPVLIYCWLLPLAEGNGVFELDVRAIHQRAMSYHDIVPEEELEQYLNLFRDYGLLFVWESEGRRLGFWTNINKRLPKPTGNIKFRWPNPPEEELRKYVSETKQRLCQSVYSKDNPYPRGLGLEVGLDLERGLGESKPEPALSLEKDEDMNIKNALTDKAREILGVRLAPNDINWPEVKALVRVYGEDGVVEQFEKWSKSQTKIPNYPLSGFIRIADGLLSGKFYSSVSPEELASLVTDLVVISDGRVIFNNNQKQALAGLLDGNSPADIKSAFQEFWGNIENDDFSVRQAAKTFTEAAEQLLAVQARRRAKERQTQELLRASTEAEQKRAAEELAARMKADDELDALIEDSLPQ